MANYVFWKITMILYGLEDCVRLKRLPVDLTDYRLVHTVSYIYFILIFLYPPEAIVCWSSETWVSGTPDRLESSGRNRTCPRRRPLRPKPAAVRRWGLCRCAGRPAGTARSRTTPTGTIGHSEHTIFALRFAHLQHTPDNVWLCHYIIVII